MSALRAAKKIVKNRDGPTWKQQRWTYVKTDGITRGNSQADIDYYVV